MAQSFEIFSLTVGGGRLGLCPVPGGTGDLAGDVGAVRDWGASHVLSLTELHEVETLGAQALPEALAALDVGWSCFPIRDFDVPDEADLAQWEELCAEFVELLSEGKRLLVHCRGGCGRSGMVVLKLMVLCGEAPEAALARLRAVRPCAVETPQQMHWATQGVL